MTKKSSKYEKDYVEADRYVVINDGDIDLHPIILSLPKPPPIHLIDGYGLPIEEQRFDRLRIPRRLEALQQEAIDKTSEELSTNKNSVVTLLKIQETFWELFRQRSKDLRKEVDFIRRVWWHRRFGFWFFNRGKPTWISPWHFFYLNFWTMDVDGKVSFPDYRDRDRKEFVFFDYAYNTTETFDRLDEHGYAIKEDDGTYKMKDIGRRVCFGTIQPKNRRSGNTNKNLCIGLEILTRTMGTDGMGIMSYSEDNARSHFKDKLMPAYAKLPIWLKPFTVSGRTSDTLKLDVGKNDYGKKALGTYCDYATTSSSKFYDGKKKVFILTDEAGKTGNVDVLERHNVNKHTCAQGNGSLIHGFMGYPSTSEYNSDGAFKYRNMADGSNFYVRVKESGQTETGLYLIFVPADEGLDDFIDSYGYSVKNSIKDYQRAEGKKQTANEYLQGERNFLLKKGDPESMRQYRHAKKLFPLQIQDCWLGEAGDLGFPLEKIDTRLAELRRENDTVRCNLEWVDGVFGGNVKMIEDKENGRFIVSKLPPDGVSNKKVKVKVFNPIAQTFTDAWRPMNAGMFTLGADPFKFGSKNDAKVGASLGKNSRLSDGGIAIVWNYDESLDGDRPKDSWDSYRVVLTYRYRCANTDEYNADVLKAAIYFGAMVFPETNIPTTYEYFVRHGYSGYLLHDIDKYTGQIKPKAGMDSLERSKQELFALLRDYLDYRCHVEQHEDFLMECKHIKGMEEMRYNDLLAAVGIALVGAKSPYFNKINKISDEDHDVSEFFFW